LRWIVIKAKHIDLAALNWDAVDEGMRRAVQRAVWEHKQLGYPIYAMKDGRMQWIPPEEIDVEKPAEDDPAN
jgi:hypothetical protein